MIMKMLELFRDILFSNQNSGVSDVFRDLGPLVLFFALSSRFLTLNDEKFFKKVMAVLEVFQKPQLYLLINKLLI